MRKDEQQEVSSLKRVTVREYIRVPWVIMQSANCGHRRAVFGCTSALMRKLKVETELTECHSLGTTFSQVFAHMYLALLQVIYMSFETTLRDHWLYNE